MLTIDGSYGEGGGQILRTAVSLSVLTHTPVRVERIRSNRPNPGLRPQHRLALLLMKQLSNASTSGLSIGSTEITFQPKQMVSGSFDFDIKTAGSMVLVFQTILLGMVRCDHRLHVRLHGGSDVKWAPSWDYFTHVFLPVIKDMGVSVSAELMQRGYYPKGGGVAEITIDPIEDDLVPVVFDSFHPKHVYGRVHLGNLPDHIAKRMKHRVMKKAVGHSIHANIRTERVESLSPGVGVTLWTHDTDGMFGVASIGEKGVSAETVADNAVDPLIADIMSDSTVDLWLSDQLLPYLVLTNGRSVFRVRRLTGHFKTNLWVLKQFFSDFAVSFVEGKDSVLVTIDTQ